MALFSHIFVKIVSSSPAIIVDFASICIKNGYNPDSYQDQLYKFEQALIPEWHDQSLRKNPHTKP